MARLRIDAAAGILEVEGDEPFVREIYADFKDKLPGRGSLADDAGSGAAKTIQNNMQKVEEQPRRRGKGAGSGARESYILNKQLDLRANGKVSLKEFYDQKAPKTAVQRNAVFVYYLKKILEHSPITLHDIYTCYSEVKVKAPDAFRQSIKDTSGSRYGYLDASNMDDIQIPLRGIQFVEHDLPEQEEQ
jgi:hypothetical protein